MFSYIRLTALSFLWIVSSCINDDLSLSTQDKAFGKWELYKIREVISDNETDEVISDDINDTSLIVIIDSPNQINTEIENRVEHGQLLNKKYLSIGNEISGKIIYLKENELILNCSDIKTLNTFDLQEKHERWYYFRKME